MTGREVEWEYSRKILLGKVNTIVNEGLVEWVIYETGRILETLHNINVIVISKFLKHY